MTMNNEVCKDREFELADLFGLLKRFWIIILATTVIFASAGLVYTKTFKKDVYVGTAYFWVNGNRDNISSSSTMGAAQMAANYADLANKELLLRRAVQNYGLDKTWDLTEDGAVARLRGMVSSGSQEESFVFYVSASSTDKDIAYQAISAVQHTMIDVVATVNGDADNTLSNKYITLIGEVHSVQDISVSSPSLLKNVAVFALVGFIGSFVVMFAYDKKRTSCIDSDSDPVSDGDKK